MQTLITYLEKNDRFKKAVKRHIKYKRVDSTDAITAKSFYIHCGDKDKMIKTVIDGKTETTNVLKRGDALITGPLKEQYVIACAKFLKIYNVIDEIAVPRPIERLVARVTKKDLAKSGLVSPISFVAPWGEPMTLEAGDYLAKDPSGGHYRIEKNAFKRTLFFVQQ